MLDKGKWVSYSGKQWRLRKSVRRCKDCVVAGNELVLFTKGRKRLADDECPLCSRLLPIDNWTSTVYSCCMKTVCDGCILAGEKRGILCSNCPFCRAPVSDSDETTLEMIHKRVEAGDPAAFYELGVSYSDGKNGLKKDMFRAVGLLERAAELGFIGAHCNLGLMFDEHTTDKGVDKDRARAVEHYESAAKHGDVISRHNLGRIDYCAGNCGVAMKHWAISAKLGCKYSLDAIKENYTEGMASKSDYAEALRGYYDAVKETSSPDREQAKDFKKAHPYPSWRGV